MVSCVYKILNTVTGKIYIGSTYNFEERKYQHLAKLKLGTHSSKHLQHSFLKYGIDVFDFIIIEKVDVNLLIEREQFYLDLLKPWHRNIGYNILKKAGTTLGYKHSAETKNKISRKGVKHPMYGKKHSINTRKKISNAGIGRKHNDVFFEKMSKPVLQYSKDLELIKRWSSGREAARALNISHIHISNCCRNKRKTAYGFIWKFDAI